MSIFFFSIFQFGLVYAPSLAKGHSKSTSIAEGGGGWVPKRVTSIVLVLLENNRPIVFLSDMGGGGQEIGTLRVTYFLNDP